MVLRRIKLRNAKARHGESYTPTPAEHIANIFSHLIFLVPAAYIALIIAGVALSTSPLIQGLGKFNESRSTSHEVFSRFERYWVERMFTAVTFSTTLLALFAISSAFHVFSLLTSVLHHHRMHYTCCSKSRKTLQLLDRAIIYLHIASTYTAWLALPSGVVYPHASRFASTLRHLMFAHPTSLAGHDWPSFDASCPASAAETPSTACVGFGEARDAADQYPMPGYMAFIWACAVFGTIYQLCCFDRHKLLSVSFYVVYGVGPGVVLSFLTTFDFDRGLYEISAGGVAFLSGVVFFRLDGRLPFAHAIWHLFVCAGATLHAISILHYLYVPALLARHDVNLQALVDASRIVIGPSLSSSSPELVQALTSVPLLDRTIFELYSQLSRTVCTLVRGYLPLCVSVDTL